MFPLSEAAVNLLFGTLGTQIKELTQISMPPGKKSKILIRVPDPNKSASWKTWSLPVWILKVNSRSLGEYYGPQNVVKCIYQ